MHFKALLMTALVTWAMTTLPVSAADGTVFKETFDSLDSWEPLTFEKIDQHSRYAIQTKGTDSFLRAESNGSASGIVCTRPFDVYEAPVLRWRWKVDRVYDKGNASTKQGDDYPIRLYVLFSFDPEQASTWERIKYGTYKAVYGEYPPHSTLNYIWANREHGDRILTNTYTEKAKMILLRQGAGHVGRWVDEEVDMLKDYREAFGQDPPATASLAIMNDSDNTQESSVSWLDDLEVARR